MSTSGPSPIEENTRKIALLKEQMAEMMPMMQQLVIGGGWDLFGPTLEGPVPQSKNEAWPLLEPNQGQIASPFVS